MLNINKGMRNKVSMRPSRKQRSRRHGQALVELAFVTTILLSLTMGLIQWGMIYNASISLTNIARDGARYAAVHGTESNVEALVEDYVQTRLVVGTAIPASALPDANITVSFPNTNATSGQPIRVSVEYDMRRKFILPSGKWGFLADTNNRWSRFTTTATMMIE